MTFAWLRGAVEERSVHPLDRVRTAVLLDLQDAAEWLEEREPVGADAALELGGPEGDGKLLDDGRREEELGRGAGERLAIERGLVPMRGADDDRGGEIVAEVLVNGAAQRGVAGHVDVAQALAEREP